MNPKSKMLSIMRNITMKIILTFFGTSYFLKKSPIIPPTAQRTAKSHHHIYVISLVLASTMPIPYYSLLNKKADDFHQLTCRNHQHYGFQHNIVGTKCAQLCKKTNDIYASRSHQLNKRFRLYHQGRTSFPG